MSAHWQNDCLDPGIRRDMNMIQDGVEFVHPHTLYEHIHQAIRFSFASPTTPKSFTPIHLAFWHRLISLLGCMIIRERSDYCIFLNNVFTLIILIVCLSTWNVNTSIAYLLSPPRWLFLKVFCIRSSVCLLAGLRKYFWMKFNKPQWEAKE